MMNKFTRNDTAVRSILIPFFVFFFVNIRSPLRLDSKGRRICFPFPIFALLCAEDSMGLLLGEQGLKLFEMRENDFRITNRGRGMCMNTELCMWVLDMARQG